MNENPASEKQIDSDKNENDMAKKAKSSKESKTEAEIAPEQGAEPVKAEEPSAESVLTTELNETKDKYLRLAAEYENFKKISQREVANSLKFANEGLILALLPTIDSLEQAVIAGKKSGESQDIVVGVEMVLKQMLEALAKFGVTSESAKGQKFDPSKQEAVSELVDDEHEAGTILEEFQKSYTYNGRLLRPARVVVSKKPSEKNE